VQLRQPGLLHPLDADELSGGTLRFLLWAAALLTHPAACAADRRPPTGTSTGGRWSWSRTPVRPSSPAGTCSTAPPGTGPTADGRTTARTMRHWSG
jgi:hypothetical protein